MTTNRLEAFSDGVIAIIITIMVLELKVPHGFSFEALKPVFPKFISYILSFVYVAIYWNNHHHLFHAIKKVNGKVLWVNLSLLFALSIIPFTTSWMGENQFQTNTVVLYGINLLFCAITFLILEIVSIKNDGDGSPVSLALANRKKEYLSVLLYLLGIALSYVHTTFSLLCYLIVAILWVVPDMRIEKVLK